MILFLMACSGAPAPETSADAPPTAAPAAAATPAPRTARNLVIVTLDTTRADHLEIYGYPRPTSPALALFGQQSIVFDAAYAPTSTTLPAHWSLFTGVYPFEHGLLDNMGVVDDGQVFIANPEVSSLVEVAQAQGFQTAAFVSSVALKRHTGVDRGFQTFDEPAGTTRVAPETVERALSWLEGAQAPFLLWVHFIDPHWPYAPPEHFSAMFHADASVEAMLQSRGAVLSISQIHQVGAGGGETTQARTVDLIDAYDAEIRLMDSQLARLFSGLQKQGLWHDTAVVIAGDHGESLGQHRALSHGDIHGEQLRVPLMVAIPGAAPRRVAEAVSLVDVAAMTLPQVAGDWSGFLASGRGRDVLSAAIQGPVYAQRTEHPFGATWAWSMVEEGWKVVVEPDTDRVQLFNLMDDPHELNDRAAGEPERLAEMRARLLTEFDRQRASYTPTQGGALDGATREQLEALGYIH